MPRIELCTVPQADKEDILAAATADGRSVSDWGSRTLARVAREEIAAYKAAQATETEASP